VRGVFDLEAQELVNSSQRLRAPARVAGAPDRLVISLIVVNGEVDCCCVVVDRIVIRHYQVIPAKCGPFRHISTTVYQIALRFVVKFRR
jgi:hypothetical protein